MLIACRTPAAAIPLLPMLETTESRLRKSALGRHSSANGLGLLCAIRGLCTTLENTASERNPSACPRPCARSADKGHSSRPGFAPTTAGWAKSVPVMPRSEVGVRNQGQAHRISSEWFDLGGRLFCRAVEGARGPQRSVASPQRISLQSSSSLPSPSQVSVVRA